MHRYLLAFVVLMITSTCALAASSDLERVYVFGDSFSDNGAGYGITRMMMAHGIKEAETRPADHYWNHRWSNGPVAVEVLAKVMDLKLVDYAIGGARTGEDNYQPWMNLSERTGLQAQVDHYLDGRLSQGHADPDGLYVLMASANDLAAYQDGDESGSADEVARQSAANIESALEDLVDAGAENVLVIGSPDVADSPALAGDEDKQEEAEQFQKSFDQAVKDKTEKLQDRHDFNLSWFDLTGFMQKIHDNASEFGFSHVSTACQPMESESGDACDSPDKYFFWDEDHPSRRAHDLIGKTMAEQVEKDLDDE